MLPFLTTTNFFYFLFFFSLFHFYFNCCLECMENETELQLSMNTSYPPCFPTSACHIHTPEYMPAWKCIMIVLLLLDIYWVKFQLQGPCGDFTCSLSSQPPTPLTPARLPACITTLGHMTRTYCLWLQLHKSLKLKHDQGKNIKYPRWSQDPAHHLNTHYHRRYRTQTSACRVTVKCWSADAPLPCEAAE